MTTTPYFVTYHWEGSEDPATIRFMSVNAAEKWLAVVREPPPGCTRAIVTDASPELAAALPSNGDTEAADENEAAKTPPERPSAVDWFYSRNGGRLVRKRKRDRELEETSAGIEDGAHGVTELAVSLDAEAEEPRPEVSEEPQLAPADDDGAKQPDDVAAEAGQPDARPALRRNKPRKKH